MAVAYGSHLHLGLLGDGFLKMSKEVTYFTRLILVLSVNFSQPFSIVIYIYIYLLQNVKPLLAKKRKKILKAYRAQTFPQ